MPAQNQGYAVINTFATQSGNVPASELDANFNQAQLLGNTLASYGNYYVDSGSANAIVVTVSSPLVANYVAGLPFQIKVAALNTGATSINLNAAGAQALVYPGTAAAMLPGQLPAGGIASVMYDGLNFQYLGSIFGQGAFTGTWNGFSAPPSATTIYWTVSNAQAALILPASTGTSNAVTFSLAGLPSYLAAYANLTLPIPDGAMTDAGATIAVANASAATALLAAGQTSINFQKNGNLNGWVSGSVRGTLAGISLSYPTA